MTTKSLRTIDNLIVGSLLPSPETNTTPSPPIDYPNDIHVIPNLLTLTECQTIIKRANKRIKAFLDITGYPASKRQSARMCILDHNLAHSIWSRLIQCINFPSTIQPYGFISQGIWKPLGINECFRVSRYVAAQNPNQGFVPHYDGQYAKTVDVRSIYTLVIYLTDEFDGGETTFYHKKDELFVPDTTLDELLYVNGGLATYTQLPLRGAIGTCIIFPHNTLHSCKPLSNGTKIILKTDIVFHRISCPDQPFDIRAYIRAAHHHMTAQHLELHNHYEEASNLYEKSISIRMSPHSNNFLTQRDTWFIIIQYLNPLDTLMLHYVCRTTNLYTKQLIVNPTNPPMFTRLNPYDLDNIITHYFHTDQYYKNIEGCVRLSAIICLTEYETHDTSHDFLAHCDPQTGRILKCNRNHLYYCAYHGIPCSGRFYNLDSSTLPTHNYNSVFISGKNALIDCNKILHNNKKHKLQKGWSEDDNEEDFVDDASVDDDDETNIDDSDENETDESKADENRADESIADESRADESRADESRADESIADESIADESIADESIADESIADESRADESRANENIDDTNINIKALFHQTISDDIDTKYATKKSITAYTCIEHGISVCDCGWNGNCRLADDIRTSTVVKKIMSNALIFDFSTHSLSISSIKPCHESYLNCYEISFPKREFYHAACKCGGVSFGTTFESKIKHIKKMVKTLEKIHVCAKFADHYGFECIEHKVKYIAVNVL